MNISLASTKENISENIQQSTENVSSGPTSSSDNILVPHDRTSTMKEGVASKMATTTYVDDNVVVSTDEKQDAHVDYRTLNLFQSQESVDDIISFLKKPIRLASGTFNVTDTYSFLNSYSMPYAAFTSPQAAIWRNKLSGFFGIRMDLKFRIVVNANKFQQGRYSLGWVPHASMGTTISNLKSVTYNNMHMATLVQRTTVKRVEIDLAQDTAAELTIPYMSPYSFYPLNQVAAANNGIELGYLNLYPYIPLASPEGSTTAGYTIYVSLDNVQLFGAASPQSGLAMNDEEISNKTLGPISSISNAVTKGFKEFEDIPLLGAYAKSIGWISDCITKTASIFGLSKPNPGSNALRVQIQTAPTHSTIDGDTDARSLGIISKPGTVSVAGISGTNYDEMDFSFIKSKPAWFTTFSMSTSNAVDDIISIWEHFPEALRSDVTSPIGTARNYTPVAFLASQFQYWRGSIVYRIKIVKTGFHSGRISVSFFPTDESSFQADEQYVNRMIIDIRECNEFEVVVPYISRSPWLDFGQKMGIMKVRVVDPLVAPTTVSPTISFVVEPYGGKDFEVSVPGPLSYRPTSFAPQSISPNQMEGNLMAATIGSSKVNSNPLAMTSMCIGEKITSVRALLKRFTPLTRIAEPGFNLTLNSKTVDICPDAIFLQIATVNGTTDNGLNPDGLSLWASCYAMMSGGIRIRDIVDLGLCDSSGSRIHSHVLSEYVPNRTIGRGAIDASPKVSFVNVPRVFNQLEKDNTLTVEVPQYTRALSRSVGDCIVYVAPGTSGYDYTDTAATTSGIVSFSIPEGYTVTPQPFYTLHNLSRAGADDLQLYGFISVPPLVGFSAPDRASSY